MTAPLPTPNSSDYSTHGLRSYRGAVSYLKSREIHHSLDPCEILKVKASSPACGSPPRFRASPSPSASRCRTRTPSPPRDEEPSSLSSSLYSSSSSSFKAPRSVSPGGTPASSAGAASRQAEERRVRWAEALVASLHTRPRTLRQDVPALFYSRADEKRFRREAETEPAPEVPPAEDLEPLWSPQRGERKDYAISKAVVVFGDSTRTYGAERGGGCAAEAALEVERAFSFSFDDAAFWNGCLTWS